MRRKEALTELLRRVEGLGPRVVMVETKHADPRDLVLKTANRLQGQTELLAKLIGELNETPTVNVLVAHPEWLAIRSTLFGALQSYPEAREAVAGALAEVTPMLALTRRSGPPVQPSTTLASDLAAALDPVVLARRAGIEPDPWQADVLRSPTSRMLLNCSRQSGKSTTTALLALHTATYRTGALVLLLSPSLRQSAELFRTLAGLYTTTGATVPSRAESALRLELENGSRIISLPAKEATIRGYAGVALLVIDEAARVPNDLYTAVRPMLATSGGRLVALSTPFGTRGWWYEAWESPDNWKRVEIPATACPRIPASFLAEERRTLGEWWFSQEYLCQFLDAQSAAFRREDIERAFSEDVEQWAL